MAPFRISAERTAPVLISALPTEPVRSCFAPTLFPGSVSAYDVPPSAANSAMLEATFA
jgi:hypothetical protein